MIEGTEMKERLPENQKSIKNPTPPSTRPAFQVQSEQGRAEGKHQSCEKSVKVHFKFLKRPAKITF